jgi:hypothetical protein
LIGSKHPVILKLGAQLIVNARRRTVGWDQVKFFEMRRLLRGGGSEQQLRHDCAEQ